MKDQSQETRRRRLVMYQEAVKVGDSRSDALEDAAAEFLAAKLRETGESGCDHAAMMVESLVGELQDDPEQRPPKPSDDRP